MLERAADDDAPLQGLHAQELDLRSAAVPPSGLGTAERLGARVGCREPLRRELGMAVREAVIEGLPSHTHATLQQRPLPPAGVDGHVDAVVALLWRAEVLGERHDAGHLAELLRVHVVKAADLVAAGAEARIVGRRDA